MAAVNRLAAPFGQAATQAPQPMHSAASIAASATGLGIGIRLASGAPPVGAVMKPPASMMRSNAARSHIRSLMIGNAAERHGSTTISSPSVNVRMCSWHVAVPRCGPWAWPLIISEHVPQMPSRQSWSKTIASLPVGDQALVEDVEQLEERRLVADLVDRVASRTRRRRRARPGARS